MKKILLLCVLMALIHNLNAQDMRANSSNSLFSDNKASRIGDAVTILVVESSQASNNAETSSGRSSELGFGANASLGKSSMPEAKAGISTNNEFNGSGSTKTTGLIRTKISATIDSVLANGNMVIKGSRKITINGEEQVVKIRGIVRSADILADNSVYSYSISEAEINFEGSGIIADSQKPGWLTRFFHWIF